MRVAVLAPLLVLGGTALLYAQGMNPYFSAVGPGSYHHASTAEEGAARGMADVVRSQGAANLMNSEAAINLRESQKKGIENDLLYTQTYFQKKSINQQYRAAQRTPPPSQQQAIRLSQARLPDRLSANKIDPLTGELAWPLGLRMDSLKDDRDRLDAIYAERADKGFLTPDQYVEVKKLTSEMTEELRKYSQQLGGNASIEARKFLESLAYEAGFQAG
ncbi:MAG: hypothetical protein H6821_04750 [Planctomycetaceae bacterium]|mgnify:CR=1 FL=1|nr:hypothetical protein [Planctomycetales bacterium]MCB9873469.1 hypothetical protein [Planctomycetaceae bacterium]MCB9940379.1 hypothetical protein [Planctomycetaceae bacterium]HRX77857.1 hypothetical protein [Pirellulaceae bacterium]